MASRSAGSKSGARAGRGAASSRQTASGRADKSVEAFRDALERSVTLSRDRLQEVFDDAVERGRMTRGDANEIVSSLVGRGRRYTDDLLKDLEKLVEQARKEVESRTAASRRQAARAAERVGRGVREVADRPLAEADRLRRRVRPGDFPISAYDQLTAVQVRSRLTGLSAADLRKVRTHEKRGKARKGILGEIEKRLAKK